MKALDQLNKKYYFRYRGERIETLEEALNLYDLKYSYHCLVPLQAIERFNNFHYWEITSHARHKILGGQLRQGSGTIYMLHSACGQRLYAMVRSANALAKAIHLGDKERALSSAPPAGYPLD